MSLIFSRIGTQSRERKWSIPSSEDKLICKYKYFHVLTSDLGFSYDIRWFLFSNPGEDLTEENIKEYFPDNQPSLGIWEHYALFIIFVPIIVLMLFGK